MIQIKGLSKSFGRTLAVDSLTLEVSQGEVFGLLGPNGAGKTTTIRLLGCLIAPDSGEAWVNGLHIRHDSQRIRRIVGILTETPGLYPRLTAYENLALYARLYEVKDVPGQVERYLRLIGLWEERDQPVSRFSRGMAQKVAIARALIHEPQVLLLDEPTAALDPHAARLVRDFIAGLKGQGRTILLCTHNLDEAERLCDRVGVIKQRLIALDTPHNLRLRLYGRQTVLQLRSLDEALIATVRKLAFVEDVQYRDGQLIVTLSDPESQNHLLVEQLVAAGGQVTYVTEARHSLEDVYLSLIKETEGR